MKYFHKVFHKSGKIELEIKEYEETEYDSENLIIHFFKIIPWNKTELFNVPCICWKVLLYYCLVKLTKPLLNSKEISSILLFLF